MSGPVVSGYILQGKYRRQKLPSPPAIGRHDEITGQKLKEAIFNIAASHLHAPPDLTLFYDLFAGSGQIGFEALSRSFSYVFFFEIDGARCSHLRRWIDERRENNHALVQKTDTFRRMEKILREPPDDQMNLAGRTLSRIFFADPPYTRDGLFDPKAVTRLLLAFQQYSEEKQTAEIQSPYAQEILLIQTPSVGSKYYRRGRNRESQSALLAQEKAKEELEKTAEMCKKIYTYGNHRLLLAEA